MSKDILNEVDAYIQTKLLDEPIEEACPIREKWDAVYAHLMRSLEKKENFKGYEIPSFMKDRVGA